MENLILFGTFAILLFLRVPIGVSLGMAVVAFLSYTGMQPLTYLASNMWTALDSFPLMAIPFFILAGALMEGGELWHGLRWACNGRLCCCHRSRQHVFRRDLRLQSGNRCCDWLHHDPSND